jgi:hypothetical protein
VEITAFPPQVHMTCIKTKDLCPDLCHKKNAPELLTA